MQQSENIEKLASALSSLQASLRPVFKGETNPFFKSKYADLSACWEAIREPLAKQGLSVTQGCDYEQGADLLTTQVQHISGQWQRFTMRLHLSKQDPQGQGSAITYARRYALAAALGLSQTDDDAEAACRPSSHNQLYGQANKDMADDGHLTIPQRKEVVAWFRERCFSDLPDFNIGDIDHPNEAELNNAIHLCFKELKIDYTERFDDDAWTAVVADQNETKRRQSAQLNLLCTEQQRANLVRDGLRHGWTKDDQSEWLRQRLGVDANDLIKTKLTIAVRNEFIKHMEANKKGEPSVAG